MPCVTTSLGPACLSRRLADEKEDVAGGENSGGQHAEAVKRSLHEGKALWVWNVGWVQEGPEFGRWFSSSGQAWLTSLVCGVEKREESKMTFLAWGITREALSLGGRGPGTGRTE